MSEERSHPCHGVYTFSFVSCKVLADQVAEATFSTNSSGFTFFPGQYIRMTLPQVCSTVAGGNTRDFAIASPPETKGQVTIIFRASSGVFETTLTQRLALGDKVFVMGPFGFFNLPDDPKIPVVLLSCGLGIAPFLSMIRSFVREGGGRTLRLMCDDDGSGVVPVYLTELRSVAAEFPNFQVTSNTGPLSSAGIKCHVPITPDTKWYISGPPDMVISLVKDICEQLQVPEEHISTQEGTLYDQAFFSDHSLPSVEKHCPSPITSLDQAFATSLFQAVGQAALISITDTNGTILFVNDTFVSISKYTRDDLILETHRILKSAHHPPQFYAVLWQTIRAGNIWRGEMKNRAKDGSMYWADTCIIPVKGEVGLVDRYISIQFSITPKKLRELSVKKKLDHLQQHLDELGEAKRTVTTLLKDREKEQQNIDRQRKWYEAVLENIADGVVVVDTSEVTMFANAATERLLQIKKEDLIGKQLIEIASIEDASGEALRDNDRPVVRAIMTGKSVVSNKFYFLARPGKRKIPVSIAASPIIVDGVVVGAVSNLRDSSERKRIEDAKTEFVSLASHQLRTPLSAMKWCTEVLVGGEAGKLTPKQLMYLHKIYRSNQRMIDLIDSLLNVSRIELGTFAVELQFVDVFAMVNAIVHEEEGVIQKKRINLTKNFSKDVPTIQTDQKFFRMVVQNLVSNAIKYTPALGHVDVRISLDKKKKCLCIAVADSGYGIPSVEQENVFVKFFRGSNVKEKDIDGNGLGLYIVKMLVEKLGGKIWFASEDGRGSTFVVTLPIKSSSQAN